MLFTDIIRKKRDGGTLSARELQFFAAGLSDTTLPPEQIAALAMAICLRSLSATETGWLTAAMAASGDRLTWDEAQLGGPVADKHSTGGVGDKVSLVLAPLAAACGLFVPMISGRGLGHTGGTVDKCSSIPGYELMPDLARLRRVVTEVGCAIVGQSARLAPADRRLYAIRDVTATVESIPLITASILSKKLAAGIDGLVLDVKLGSGSFMPSLEQAQTLARSVIATAAAQGMAARALLTDMDQPLGTTAGNALEMAEACAYLDGSFREPRLHEVVMALVAEMLVLSGLAGNRNVALTIAGQALDNGAAAEKFARMVTALGGPGDFLPHYRKYLPVAPVRLPVPAARTGYLSAVDTRAVGNAIIELGGGRRDAGDRLDLSVGFSDILATGSEVGRDRALATVHAATPATAERAAAAYSQACSISDTAPESRPVVHETLSGA